MKSTTPIANHEMYTLSSDGGVYSGKLDMYLTPAVTPNGYQMIVLDQQPHTIHRLVALHFIPNPYGHPIVNHKDGDKLNNSVDNLEWCTHEQNTQHALVMGLRGGYVHVDTKRALIQRVLQGELIADLASEVGNHPSTLSKMLRVQAKKDGLESEWKEAMVRRRRSTARRNLELINAAN